MRNIPIVTKNLLIVNVVAFLVCYLFGKDASGNFMLNDILGLHFFMASDFHVYQLITYMFMHGGFEHIIFNMFALWMFGCVVERVWGAKKFLFYYIACGVGAGLFQEAAQYVSYLYNDFSAYQFIVDANGARLPMGDYLNLWATVGASGAIYAILLAFGMIYPNERIFIFHCRYLSRRSISRLAMRPSNSSRHWLPVVTAWLILPTWEVWSSVSL